MKTLKILMILLVLSTGIAKAQFTTAELQVSGLTCALCAKATEQSLKTLPFVSSIKPDLIRNVFVITFKPGQPIDFDLMGKKVQDAGFFVNSFKAIFNFDNVKVTNNYFSYGGTTFQVMNPADKSLNGEIAVTLVDKGLAPRYISKKYAAQFAADPQEKAGKVYHVTI
jgi:copper chaperone CopZ